MSRWSFKEQREFIEIAQRAKSLDEIVKRTGRAPAAVRKLAVKFGVKLPQQIATDAQLLAARDRERKKRPMPAGKKNPADEGGAKLRVLNTLWPA